jgi:hypothetical protein
MKGEANLVEGNMPRHYDAARLDVETAVSAVIRWITKKDARHRTWSEFVRSGGRLIGIAEAPKKAQMVIGRRSTEE